MKKIRALGVFASLALVSTFAAASVPMNVGHGVNCQPSYGQQGIIGYGEPGIGNMVNNQSARVFCPLSPYIQAGTNSAYSPAVQSATLLYSDSAQNNPFSCYMYAVDAYGGGHWAATKYTCSQYGGCPDSTSSFKGSGTLSWAQPFWGVTPGFPSYGFSCTIPPAESYASWVTEFAINQ